MKHNTRTIVIALLVLVALIVSACGTVAEQTTAPASLTETSINMAWVHEYSASYIYAAEINQHFADNGLDVTVNVGGFGPDGYIDSIAEVVNGNSEFGLGSGPALVQARADGQPVVAILTALQRSPDSLISLSNNDIVRPQDLSGHTVAVTGGGGTAIYNAFLADLDIDPAGVNTIERTEFGIDSLVSGDVDVIYGWLINEGVLVREAGLEPNIILLSDYGIDSYSSVLFTTEDTIENNPELVEAMVRSLIEGLGDVVADPPAAIDMTLTYDESLDYDAQLRRLEAMVPLMNPAGSKLGMMDPSIWDLTYQILLDQGLLTNEFEITDLYTMDFLNNVYANPTGEAGG